MSGKKINMIHQNSWLSQNTLKVPVNQYLPVICSSFTETKSRCSIVPFAVDDINSKILGTPVFEKSFQKFKSQDFTMNSKHSFNDQPTTVSFTTVVEKNLPFFSFIYQMNF